MFQPAILLYLLSQSTLLDTAHNLRLRGDSAAAESLLLSAPPSPPAEQPARLLMLAGFRMEHSHFDSARLLLTRVVNHAAASTQIAGVAQARILQTYLQQGEYAAAYHQLNTLSNPLPNEPLLLAFAALTSSANREVKRAQSFLHQLLLHFPSAAADPVLAESTAAASMAAAQIQNYTLALKFSDLSIQCAQGIYGLQSVHLFPFLVNQVLLAKSLRLSSLRDSAANQAWQLLTTYQSSHHLLSPVACDTLRPAFRGPQRKQLQRWCAAVAPAGPSQTVAAALLAR